MPSQNRGLKVLQKSFSSCILNFISHEVQLDKLVSGSWLRKFAIDKPELFCVWLTVNKTCILASTGSSQAVVQVPAPSSLLNSHYNRLKQIRDKEEKNSSALYTAKLFVCKQCLKAEGTIHKRRSSAFFPRDTQQLLQSCSHKGNLIV